jgi:hypothetical protein
MHNVLNQRQALRDAPAERSLVDGPNLLVMYQEAVFS